MFEINWDIKSHIFPPCLINNARTHSQHSMDGFDSCLQSYTINICASRYLCIISYCYACKDQKQLIRYNPLWRLGVIVTNSGLLLIGRLGNNIIIFLWHIKNFHTRKIIWNWSLQNGILVILPCLYVLKRTVTMNALLWAAFQYVICALPVAANVPYAIVMWLYTTRCRDLVPVSIQRSSFHVWIPILRQDGHETTLS